MEEYELPIVPFGKYKDKSILELLADKNYVEWLKQQSWFPNQKKIYNIIVNQTIHTSNNTKTPEHNKLQNLFLDDKNVEKLLLNIYQKKYKSEKISNVNIYSDNIIFEGIYNWDLIVKDNYWYLCECSLNDEPNNRCNCEIKKKYREKYNIPDYENNLRFYELYCEIKTSLGDDYPCVLRKMKSQIELTNNHIEKYNKNIKDEYKKEYDEDWKMRQYWKQTKNSYHYCISNDCIKPKYIIIIKDFNSSTTSKEQLVIIFEQSNIEIIFINELIDNISEIKQNTIMNKPEEFEKINELEEKNKLLTETLLQSEQKIKKLEDEINLLKNDKKTKYITDFYKKNHFQLRK
jgi:uncharacterized protein (DUF3820 family)